MHTSLGLIPPSFSHAKGSLLIAQCRIESAALRCFVLNGVSVQAEPILCPFRKPIKTAMEQSELLLTWSAGSGWRRSAVTCPVCSVVAHFYFYLIIHTAFNSASLHPPPPPTHIHSVISDMLTVMGAVFLAHQGPTTTGPTSTVAVR